MSLSQLHLSFPSTLCLSHIPNPNKHTQRGNNGRFDGSGGRSDVCPWVFHMGFHWVWFWLDLILAWVDFVLGLKWVFRCDFGGSVVLGWVFWWWCWLMGGSLFFFFFFSWVVVKWFLVVLDCGDGSGGGARWFGWFSSSFYSSSSALLWMLGKTRILTREVVREKKKNKLMLYIATTTMHICIVTITNVFIYIFIHSLIWVVLRPNWML